MDNCDVFITSKPLSLITSDKLASTAISSANALTFSWSRCLFNISLGAFPFLNPFISRSPPIMFSALVMYFWSSSLPSSTVVLTWLLFSFLKLLCIIFWDFNFRETNLVFWRSNVNFPPGKFGGKTDILSSLAYGQRELVVGHFNESVSSVFVQNLDIKNLRGRKRVGYKLRRLIAPRNYVYFFSGQLVYNRLHPYTFLSDKRTDGINSAFFRSYRDLGSRSRFSCNCFNLNGSAVYLWNFNSE